MRPNTLHYVVTMEDSFVYGRHFLTSSTIQETCCGIVHCFLLGYCVTNTMHEGLSTMLRRMMSMWHVHYDQQITFSVPRDAHIPDISTTDGLMDLMALGNILELAQVLELRAYSAKVINWQEQQEMAMARWRYRRLQKFFAAFFVVFTDDQQIHTMSVFRRSLLEFAVALIQYKRNTSETAPRVSGCTATTMQDKVVGYLTSNFRELLPAFRELLGRAVYSFLWSGPTLTIKARTAEDGPAVGRRRPWLNFEDLPLYEHNDIPQGPPSTQQATQVDEDVQIVTGIDHLDNNTTGASHSSPVEDMAVQATTPPPIATGSTLTHETPPPPPTLPLVRSDDGDNNVQMAVDTLPARNTTIQATTPPAAVPGSIPTNEVPPQRRTPLFFPSDSGDDNVEMVEEIAWEADEQLPQTSQAGPSSVTQVERVDDAQAGVPAKRPIRFRPYNRVGPPTAVKRASPQGPKSQKRRKR
jgi:hypothetical protein